MRRAGEAAAQAIDPGRGTGSRLRVLLLCGPGDNGGDGFSCALALRERGHECLCWAPEASRSPDAAALRAQWEQSGGPSVAVLPASRRWDVVVDALFGIGLTRAPEAPWSEALAWAGGLGARVVALDVPSGLHADTGNWLGGTAGLAASRTVTFLADKPGLHTAEGVDAAGEVLVASLEVEVPQAPGRLNGPEAFPGACRARPRNSHKGLAGSVCVTGGAPGMVGAVLLAGRAALRLGAGRVHVDALDASVGWDPVQPELMFHAGAGLPADTVFVAGCGMGTGEAARQALLAILARPAALVLDADAINLLASDATLRGALGMHRSARILTPHPLEAARLLHCQPGTVQADRIASALEIARRFSCVALLKGAGTVIASPEGTYAINPTGTAALSTAGTGDVLAGMIGALLAQGAQALEAACAAAWLHGRAADRHGAGPGLVAGEIAQSAAQELAGLRARSPRAP